MAERTKAQHSKCCEAVSVSVGSNPTPSAQNPGRVQSLGSMHRTRASPTGERLTPTAFLPHRGEWQPPTRWAVDEGGFCSVQPGLLHVGSWKQEAPSGTVTSGHGATSP